MRPAERVREAGDLRFASDNAAMRSGAAALDHHRAAIRARLLSAGAVRSGPGSVSWTVNREVLVVAGWGRAILLQLAHPLIAEGVANHSTFRVSLRASAGRLWSTIRAMLSLTFGSDDEAITIAAGINAIHDRVSGRLAAPAGALEAGARYDAHDPDLLRWVHVTLLDSIAVTHEHLVGPLTVDERDRYCAEAAIMEPLLDIPTGLLPRNAAHVDAAMREMLASGRLGISATSRTLARAILFPRGWRLLWPVFRALQLITIGLLPPAIREGYGFAWTPRDAGALRRWTAAVRLLRRITPRVLTEWPASRRSTGAIG